MVVCMDNACTAVDDNVRCTNTILARRDPDLCHKHYMRIWREKQPKRTPKVRPTCPIIEDDKVCGDKIKDKVCSKHYNRKLRYGSYELPPRSETRREAVARRKQDRTCVICEKEIPLEEHGRRAYCSADCAFVGTQRSMRRADLKRLYGLTFEQYDEFLERQGWKCPICLEPHPGKGDYSWPVDHCHITGRNRGVLTSECNKGIGHLKDDPKILRSAISYLERFIP